MTAATNRRIRRAQARTRRRAGASWSPRAARQRRAEITTFTYSDPMFLTAVDGPSGRLCSEVATLNSGGLVDQFEYWPYGELVDDLPEGAPVFLWVGGLGYWFDTDDRRYVRHRMLRTDFGSWMQLDLLWPMLESFAYANRNPASVVDVSGMGPVPGAVAVRRFIDWIVPSEPTPLPQVPGSSPKRRYPVITSPFADDLVFRYGNYCGQKNVDTRPCRSEPLDCIDRACQRHDDCLEECERQGGYFSICGAKCNCDLYLRSRACNYFGCLADHDSTDGVPAGIGRCLAASGSVSAAFSAICVLTGGTGIVKSIGEGFKQMLGVW